MKLHLDALYPLLCDAEVTAWKICDSATLETATQHEEDSTRDTVGSQVLRHGNAVQNIHAYFLNFEQRRCCINLVAGKTTLTNVRIIPVAREDCDDGYLESISRSHSPNGLGRDRLSHQEFHLYCETILCAQFPILAAPSPPNEHTPPASPASGHPSPVTLLSKGITSTDADGTAINEEFLTSLVKEEQMMEVVRNVFGISHERAAQYDTMIYNLHGRQKPPKILAEELMRQLSQLENDQVPFYQPDQFLNQLGYREWQKLERQHITEMITKFWQGPLPGLKSGRMGPHLPNQNAHKHYSHLMVRLIRYARRLFPPSELHPSFLTTDAQRLLKEFGLRYGVGEQYRRLIYLEYVATHFLQEVWYVRHANAALCEILRTLPCTPSRLIMVMEEKKILEKCCQCFLLECQNSLRKVRHIFPGFSPHVSIGLLLELLRNTLKISSFLSGEPHPPVKMLLESWLENGFMTEYEQHKLMECYDLKLDPSRSLLSPKLLYRIIIKIRDSVRSYRNEYQAIFKSYFEIHKMAALCFYKLLMSDVRVMCEDAQLSHVDNELSLQMISFAYRLNQLDRDWVQYIPREEQAWRKAYLPEVLHWVNVVQRHAISLMLQSVASDKFSFLDIEESEVLSGMMPFCPKFPKSLSPSQVSAFSETFHLTSQDSNLTIPRSRKTRYSRTNSRETLQRHESLKRRHLDSVTSEKTSSAQTRVTLSVLDVRTKTKSPKMVCENVEQKEYRRMYSLGTVHEQTSNSLSKSLSSPEIHALMQRYEDIQKIKDQSLLRSVDDMSVRGNMFLKDQGFSRFGSLPNINHMDLIHSGSHLNDQRTYIVDSTKAFYPINGGFEFMKARQGDQITDAKTLAILQDQKEETQAVAGYDEPFVTSSKEQNQSNNEVFSKDEQEPVSPPLCKVSQNLPRRSSEPMRDLAISSMVAAAHKAFNESSASDILKLSRQSSNLSDIFKEVRAKACLSDCPSPEVRYGLPLTSSPLSVESVGNSFEVISGKLMVSSSVIDLVSLLNRTAHFVKTISEVVYPLWRVFINQTEMKATRDVSAATELRDLREQMALGRKLLLDKLKRMVFVCVSVYSQNMLAMDMCSLTEGAGRHLAGVKLLADLHAGHECGHIWGCRHSANSNMTSSGSYACFTYKNSNPRYLAAKYEPIDSQMCIRINNLYEVIDLMNHVEVQFDQNLSSEELGRELEELHLSRADTPEDQEETSAKKDHIPYMEGESGNCDFFERSKKVLQATRNALLNILTYRINLFAKDALAVLLSLQIPLVSIEGRLAPLCEFLTRHLEVLRKWLVHEAYLQAAAQLWELITQDIEDEEEKLLELKELAPQRAKLLILAIAHLIKVYSALEPELEVEMLLNAMAKVSFRLEVHTLSTRKLCKLATVLRLLQTRQIQESLNDYFVPANEVIKQLHWCLHGNRKSFTGQELLNWLLSNPQFFSMSDASNISFYGNITPLTDENCEDELSGDPELKRRAVTFCQQLLDSNIVCPLLEEKRSTQKLEGSVNMIEKAMGKVNPYPNIVECISIGSSNLSGLMGVQSVVSGRGYDTDEESHNEDVEGKSEVAATNCARNDQAFTSNSVKLEKPTRAYVSEGQAEVHGRSRSKLLGSRSFPDLHQNIGLVSPRLGTSYVKKPSVVLERSEQLKNTAASETTSNSSAYIFQGSRSHLYYLHSLTAIFEESSPADLDNGSVMNIYLANKVDFEFVMNILRSRKKYDTQAKEFVKTLLP